MLAKYYFPLKQNKKCRRILTIANTQIMHTLTLNIKYSFLAKSPLEKGPILVIIEAFLYFTFWKENSLDFICTS